MSSVAEVHRAFDERNLDLLDHVVANAIVSALPPLMEGNEKGVRASTVDLTTVRRCFQELPDWLSQDSTSCRRAISCEGQIQGALTLLRAYLSLATPRTTRAALRRKNTVAILNVLKRGDRTVAELSRKLDVSLSQLGREVTALVRADLLASIKEGRERWVSLTAAGRRAAILAAKSRRNQGATFTSKELNQMYEAAMMAEAPVGRLGLAPRHDRGVFSTSKPPPSSGKPARSRNVTPAY